MSVWTAEQIHVQPSVQSLLSLVELLLRLGLIGSYFIWHSTSADLVTLALQTGLLSDNESLEVAHLHRRTCVIS